MINKAIVLLARLGFTEIEKVCGQLHAYGPRKKELRIDFYYQTTYDHTIHYFKIEKSYNIKWKELSKIEKELEKLMKEYTE